MGSCRRLMPVMLAGLAGAALLAPGGTASAATAPVQIARPGSVLSISDDGCTAVLVRDDGYPSHFPPFWTPFIRDVVRGTTTPLPIRPTTSLVTPQVAVSGFEPRVSATPNGRWIAFSNWVNVQRTEVMVHDRWTGAVEIVSLNSAGEPANDDSRQPVLSADGRYVVFSSEASNLDPGPLPGVYRRDRWTGTTIRIDVAPGGQPADGSAGGPALSADGRTVAFVSDATNLVPGDTNGQPDVFVRDPAGTIRLVSAGLDGAGADRATHLEAALSADGRTVAFASDATNLVAGDTNATIDVFVRHLPAGPTRRVSVGPAGTQANSWSTTITLSADGRYAAFTSDATNLVAGDTNGGTDVFIRDLRRGVTRLVSHNRFGQPAHGYSWAVTLSANGRYLAFNSTAPDLVRGDTNGVDDGFVRDLRRGTTRRVTLFPAEAA